MSSFKRFLPYSVCFIFFVAYTTISIIRHDHYQSYGFDLGISDQVVWEYSQFKTPLTTVHYYPYTSILTDHIEFIYAPLSIFYWFWNDARMLLLLQSAALCFSGLPLYFLAIEKKLKPSIAFALLLSFLTFYGTQNALWFDVHSEVFGASFLAWFIYFLDKKSNTLSTIFFLLTILCKENMPLLTLLISFVYFIKRRRKSDLFYVLGSVIYLFIIFGIYFPHFTKLGYEYQNPNGILANMNPLFLFNTQDKREVFFVSLGYFGFLPLLSPLLLIPLLGNLFSYFVIGNNLKEAGGIFMHYRVTLGSLLAWSTIFTITKHNVLNKWYTAAYLVMALLLFQYILHLPLSYLGKSWFWAQPKAEFSINKLLYYLPPNASVVAQNNITPHITHRYNIFTLWPQVKTFKKHSPCKKEICNWLTWRGGTPEYLIVDTSLNWDIRDFLTNRNDFLSGVANMEAEGTIKKTKQIDNAVLYRINYTKLR